VGWRLGGEFELLIKQGHDRFRYVVVSMALSEEVRPLVEWHRIPCLRWPSFRLRWVVFFILGGLRLMRLRADLVHTVGPTPIVPNYVDLNTVTYCHAEFQEATAGAGFKGSSLGWQIGQRTAAALERRWFNKRVRVLVALSEGSAAALRGHYPRNEIAVAPRGIDLGRFKPDECTRRRLRDEHSLSPEDVIALFVDQDHREFKGLKVAIEAFAAASRVEGGPAQLWVLGAKNEECAYLAERLSIRERIRFLGYRRDPERFYQAADIFVLPTAYETFCRSAYEAAACGLPIVAPGVSGVSELVGANEAGIVIGRDAAEIARALVTLARDPKLRAQMGLVARQRSVVFEEEVVARRVLALHKSVLERPRNSHSPAVSLKREEMSPSL
jgi:UDP-glucose:(heptosyl)LPS alpha-1,3-glucosyltransferase